MLDGLALLSAAALLKDLPPSRSDGARVRIGGAGSPAAIKLADLPRLAAEWQDATEFLGAHT